MLRNKNRKWISTLVASLAAFSVYTCMYAFRKPFTVADFDRLSFLGLDYKIWLVIAQTIGYTLSKFYGIRFIAELKQQKRYLIILKLISISWIALLLFAIVPPPYNIILLLVNGFPLGMVYGIVFSYIEGRRATEFLGAVLATSFIFASGFTQSVGKFLMLEWNVDQWWMPYITGLIFFVPLLFFIWLLERTPAPDEADISMRTKRKPMDKNERRSFMQAFLPGLVFLIIAYIFLTILRDYRSNFAAEMWNELNYGKDASVFLRSEIPASVVVLVLMSLLMLVKDNMRAFMINHWIIMGGLIISGTSTLFFINGHIDAFWWMSATGTGLYISYVPFNCMLFDRLIATFRYASTAGFIIYVADSFGYLGSGLVLVVKNFSRSNNSWSNFFVYLVLIVSVVGILLISMAAIYFRKKFHSTTDGIIKLSYG